MATVEHAASRSPGSPPLWIVGAGPTAKCVSELTQRRSDEIKRSPLAVQTLAVTCVPAFVRPGTA